VTYRLKTKDLSFWSAEEISEHGFQIIQFKLKDPERPKVGLGVVILKEGKVLLSKRRNAHGEGTWAFPGGHLEFGESWEDCAKRETFEETGIAIKNICFGRATNDIFEAEQKHYITLYVVADYDSGEVVNKEPDKSEVWEWFAWDALPQPLFLPIQHLIESGFRPVGSA
jgi:8-oxo-dGTP diphosphatase